MNITLPILHVWENCKVCKSVRALTDLSVSCPDPIIERLCTATEKSVLLQSTTGQSLGAHTELQILFKRIALSFESHSLIKQTVGGWAATPGIDFHNVFIFSCIVTTNQLNKQKNKQTTTSSQIVMLTMPGTFLYRHSSRTCCDGCVKTAITNRAAFN